MAARRGTSNTNTRGSAKSRRARKAWLLTTFGDGTVAQCEFEGCEVWLNFDTITVDRFPVPGCEGGKYVHGNIRPACMKHNQEHGVKLGIERAAAKRLAAA